MKTLTPIRRIGKKAKLLPLLIKLFPENINIFIDLFMGSGVVTFAMAERCKYIYSNDIDNEIYNLFNILKTRQDELIEAIKITPYHETLWEYWKTHEEIDPIYQAIRFLYLSNFGYMGKPDTLRFCQDNSKEILLKIIKSMLIKNNIKFLCCDFREVLNKINFQKKERLNDRFIYADPPYLNTTHNYKNGFIEKDIIDLFELLLNSNIKFAISEFNNPFIINLAEKYNLKIIYLCEKQTMKNRNTEILIVNYKARNQMTLF